MCFFSEIQVLPLLQQVDISGYITCIYWIRFSVSWVSLSFFSTSERSQPLFSIESKHVKSIQDIWLVNIPPIWPFLGSLEFLLLSCHHRCGAFVAVKPDLKLVPSASLLAVKNKKYCIPWEVYITPYATQTTRFFSLFTLVFRIRWILDLVCSSKIQWNRNHELWPNYYNSRVVRSNFVNSKLK